MNTMLAGLAALAAALPLSAAAAETHTVAFEHNGVAYEVTYHPLVRTVEKTIGAHPGARSTLQRCRAVTEIAVDREVRLPDGTAALSHRLAGTQRITGHHVGPCEQNRRALADSRARLATEIAAQVRAMAANDRPALLAQIDAARTLAVN